MKKPPVPQNCHKNRPFPQENNTLKKGSKKISPPKFLDVCAFFEVTNVLEKCLPFYFQQDIACFTISIYMHKKVEIAKSEKGENKNKSILENLNTCFRL